MISVETRRLDRFPRLAGFEWGFERGLEGFSSLEEFSIRIQARLEGFSSLGVFQQSFEGGWKDFQGWKDLQ